MRYGHEPPRQRPAKPGSARVSAGDGWEHFEHGADIGVRGYGATPAEAFEQAALALTAVTADAGEIEQTICVEIACEADNLEDLLLDWLNALVYEMATRRLLFSRYRVELSDHELRGTAWGETVDAARHRPVVEVKGATYTELRVRQREDGTWMAQTVVDV